MWKSMPSVVKRRGQRGAINIGGTLMLGIAMVFISLGFIFLPITTTAVENLQAYVYTAFPTITASTFTGYTAVVGITPLLILVGFLTAGVVVGMMGIKTMKTGSGASVNPGALMLLSLSIMFISIGLIIMPVSLDGVSTVMANKDSISETASADTAVGVTTANYTLTERLYNDDTAEVISVSTNVVGDAPITIDSYTYPKLYLSSLTANVTRTATTEYYYADELAAFTGYYAILRVTPMLILIAFLSASVLSGFFGIRMMSRES